MSGLTMGSVGIRPSNMTTPKDLCDLLGGSRVINKVCTTFLFIFLVD